MSKSLETVVGNVFRNHVRKILLLKEQGLASECREPVPDCPLRYVHEAGNRIIAHPVHGKLKDIFTDAGDFLSEIDRECVC